MILGLFNTGCKIASSLSLLAKTRGGESLQAEGVAILLTVFPFLSLRANEMSAAILNFFK